MSTKRERFAQLVKDANVICFYGGAGTSTESGLADYRSKYGIWTQMEEENKRPQYFAHVQRMMEDPASFFEVRKDKRHQFEPHAGLYALAELERAGHDIRVVTQNVDGLHQKAGHRFVVELHGHHREWYCMSCGRIYQREEVEFDQEGVPRCYVDQGVVRPNVIYFGENVPVEVKLKAHETVQESDMLIIAGTTLTTGLARKLVRKYKHGPIVIINNGDFDYSDLGFEPTLIIKDSVSPVLVQLAEDLLPDYEPKT